MGKEVTEFEVDQKAVKEPIHDCDHCFQCKNRQENICQNFSITVMHSDGDYAKYTTVAERYHAVPESVPLREASIAEPTSIATCAVLDLPRLTSDDNVLVEVSGPIVVLTAIVANSVGANVVVSGSQKGDYLGSYIEEAGRSPEYVKYS